MTAFRLLAIRPLTGCNQHYLKNLREGQLYPFYNEYIFLDKNGDKVKDRESVASVSYESKIPPGLYDVKSSNGLPISVSLSAIVGKNGAGKSSLVELFFVVVYFFLVKNSLVQPNVDTDNELQQQLMKNRRDLEGQIDGHADELDGLLGEAARLREKGATAVELLGLLVGRTKQMEARQLELDNISEEQTQLTQRGQRLKQMGNTLKAEIFYEMDGAVIALKVGSECANGAYELREIRVDGRDTEVRSHLREDINQKVRADFLADHFFYTIALNYSHYGLNSLTTGKWLETLFHKNDAYKAPIVLNPFRQNGVVDVNSEAVFAKYRLLTNVLTRYAEDTDSKVMVSDKQSVHVVRFKKDEGKLAFLRANRRGRTLRGDSTGNSFLEALMREIVGYQFQDWKAGPYRSDIENYLVRKFEKIAEKYPEIYPVAYDFKLPTDEQQNASFISRLKADGSHITFKVYQALNFLKHHSEDVGEECFHQEKKAFDLSLEQLAKWIGGDIALDQLIGHIPPSIFEIDFLLADDSGGTSPFSYLSSGEQQMIHALQSVNYHINNLQSAHRGNIERVRYRAINIIYDEIELYFHPDLQRRFVKELLGSFKWLYLDPNSPVTSINVLFLTHSPFILSDIPKEYVLRLQPDGEQKKAVPAPDSLQTFGGNIHDLFEDSFFVKGTLIGAHAKDLLMGVIERAKEGRALPEDEQYIAMIGDSFLKSGINKFVTDKND